jgi:hypothetical protein
VESFETVDKEISKIKEDLIIGREGRRARKRE